MGEYDIKTKPKTVPKMVVKSRDIAVNTVKDKASVMKDIAVKKVIESKIGTEQQEQHPQKADTQAAETVENTVYTTADAVYQKGKSVVKDKIKQRSVDRVKNKETTDTEIAPDTTEQPTVKTKEEYIKGQGELAQLNKTESTKVKTKETYIRNTKNNAKADAVNGENAVQPKTRTEARMEYVQNKLNKKKTEDAVRSQVKTKETYMEQLSRERVEPRQFASKQPKQNTHEVMRSKANNKYAVKTRDKVKTSNIKRGSVYQKGATKKKSAKVAKKAVKTQKEVAKKAAKEAAIRAKQIAQKTAQAVKVAAKAIAQAVVKLAKAIAAAVKAIAGAIASLGWVGVVIVIVILIVVIIVAAIAASPFGIFISEEANDVGTIPLSQIIAEYNVELTQEIENIEVSVSHTDVDVTDNRTDPNIVIAVFASKLAGAEDDTAQDVVVFDAEKAEKLKEFFRTANTVSHTTETVTVNDVSTTKLKITVMGMTKSELMDHYNLTAKQREAVATLLEHNDVITASSHSLAITNADVQSIIDGLPDSLPQKRKDVVKNAGSLVGKVNYFWGGKSSAIGWDSAWGTMQKVTAAGSPSTGSIRAYGLDCSGFVTWVFNNSGMSVGHGTQGQKAASAQVSSVQAGDLAFVSDYSHVGIVVGKDTSGNILVIHCSSGANNVVLSTASGSGFTIFRRPGCY